MSTEHAAHCLASARAKTAASVRCPLRASRRMGEGTDAMAKPEPKVLLREAREYLKRHPEEILRLMRGFRGIRCSFKLLDALARHAGTFASDPRHYHREQ